LLFFVVPLVDNFVTFLFYPTENQQITTEVNTYLALFGIGDYLEDIFACFQRCTTPAVNVDIIKMLSNTELLDARKLGRIYNFLSPIAWENRCLNNSIQAQAVYTIGLLVGSAIHKYIWTVLTDGVKYKYCRNKQIDEIYTRLIVLMNASDDVEILDKTISAMLIIRAALDAIDEQKAVKEEQKAVKEMNNESNARLQAMLSACSAAIIKQENYNKPNEILQSKLRLILLEHNQINP